jgi:hypothetical protein
MTARPDTSTMIVVHNAFRRLLGDLPGLLRAVPSGDRPRAAVLLAHLGEVLDGLHVHHVEEDDLLWPLLLERAPADAALVLRMEEQHARVDAVVRQVREEMAAFTEAGPPEGARLADRVAELAAVLGEHLAQEEARILPLAAEHLTVAEWKALGERGMSELPKDRVLVLVGWLLDSSSPADANRFLRELPLLARLAWLVVGRRAWRAEYRTVYGAGVPATDGSGPHAVERESRGAGGH